MARLVRCDRCGAQETLGGTVGGKRFTEVWVGKQTNGAPRDLCTACGEDLVAFLSDGRAGGVRKSLTAIGQLLIDAGMTVRMDAPEHAVAELIVQRDSAVQQLETRLREARRLSDPPTEADRII